MRQTPAQTAYAARVAEFEAQGMTTSDAQGCADAEVLRGLLPDPDDLPRWAKRYRVRPLDDSVKACMVERGTPYVDIVASDMASAWRKFCVQRFGALKPDPAQWDISLVRP